MGQILGNSELASLWHPPGLGLSMIKNIGWGARLLGEPPPIFPLPQKMRRRVNTLIFRTYRI